MKTRKTNKKTLADELQPIIDEILEYDSNNNKTIKAPPKAYSNEINISSYKKLYKSGRKLSKRLSRWYTKHPTYIPVIANRYLDSYINLKTIINMEQDFFNRMLDNKTQRNIVLEYLRLIKSKLVLEYSATTERLTRAEQEEYSYLEFTGKRPMRLQKFKETILTKKRINLDIYYFINGQEKLFHDDKAIKNITEQMIGINEIEYFNKMVIDLYEILIPIYSEWDDYKYEEIKSNIREDTSLDDKQKRIAIDNMNLKIRKAKVLGHVNSKCSRMVKIIINTIAPNRVGTPQQVYKIWDDHFKLITGL